MPNHDLALCEELMYSLYPPFLVSGLLVTFNIMQIMVLMYIKLENNGLCLPSKSGLQCTVQSLICWLCKSEVVNLEITNIVIHLVGYKEEVLFI